MTFHSSPTPPPSSSLLPTQTAKWIQSLMDAASTADGHKPRVVSIHQPHLFPSLPLVAWGLSNRKPLRDIPTSLSLLSLLLLYILCDEECPPAAIVAKMWSRLLFPARLHLFPPALIPDRGFLEPGNARPSWQTYRGGEKRLSPACLHVQVPKYVSLPGGQTETMVVKLQLECLTFEGLLPMQSLGMWINV